LCSRSGGDKFAFVTLERDARKRSRNLSLSMNWWLSKHAQQYLDSQVDHEVNAEAFRTIEGWRLKSPKPGTSAQPAANGTPRR